MGKPILSICIPTYNRSRQLTQALESIVHQEGFEEIEVVISDNCSTDETEAVGLRYRELYPNIRYYRNDENIGVANQPLVLRRGTGVLRKLSNDTILYGSGAISYMVSKIKKYGKSRPLLYFLNGSRPIEEEWECDSVDTFLRKVSYHVTWIGSVAVWEEDCNETCESIGIYEEQEKTYLAQIPYLMSILKTRRKSVILNEVIMRSVSVEKKDLSYGLYDVFYNKFLGLLKTWLHDDTVSRATYDYVREDLLTNFFPYWVVQFERNKNMYQTSGEDLRALIDGAYKEEAYYGKYKMELRKKMIRLRLGQIYRFLKHQ